MSGMYGGWGSTCHPYFSKISDTAPEAWDRSLMYDRWSLREIWLHSVSSSISRLRFAEQGPSSLLIRTRSSLPKSGSQLSRKSEPLLHPTGRASAVCRTFEMTYVGNLFIKHRTRERNTALKPLTTYTELNTLDHGVCHDSRSGHLYSLDEEDL